MKNSPKIKFTESTKKDFLALQYFIKDVNFDGGRTLDWAVFSVYPKLKKHWNGKKFNLSNKELKNFVSKEHAKKTTARQKNLQIYQQTWQKVSADFFQLTNKLFPNTVWPKGKYIAYATIWGMFPRDIANKFFFIPIEGKTPIQVNAIIAHEMLHFIHYRQLFTDFPKLKSNQNAFLAWNITEIFNALIQNTKDWQKIFGRSQKPYPEHKKTVAKIQKENLVEKLTAQQLTKVIVEELRK